tara:strand:- start:1548 stop:1829 length:282 start_codon:yes stop_codon:yes gene_type:complete
MPRKIHINKYQGNTHYSIHVEDSFGIEHHIGYESEMNNDILAKIEQKACDIWANEAEPEEDLMANAIANMIELEKKSGLRFTDSRGNHRDGLD